MRQARTRHLVVEAVTGERGVVHLEVDPVLIRQAVPDEEAVDGRAVVVVLMLGRLLWLRLDEQRALEPDPVLVLGDQVEEPGELLALVVVISLPLGKTTLRMTDLSLIS